MTDALILLRVGAGVVLCVVALVLMLGGVFGVLRFPDFYTRSHAARAADGLGAALFLIGLAVLSGDAGMAVRLVVLAVLAALLAPTLSHLSANAAHAGGLAPLAGAYVAPRPGARARRDDT